MYRKELSAEVFGGSFDRALADLRRNVENNAKLGRGRRVHDPPWTQPQTILTNVYLLPPFNQTMLIRPPISMERGMDVLEDDREIGEYSSREPEIG
jgi:hypothetical protein